LRLVAIAHVVPDGPGDRIDFSGLEQRPFFPTVDTFWVDIAIGGLDEEVTKVLIAIAR
jgi:hypothetical protein